MNTLPVSPRPSRATTALILGIPVGIAVLVLALRAPENHRVFSDLRLFFTLGAELVLAGVLTPYLYRQGWRWSHVTLPFAPGDFLRAWLVFVFAYVVTTVAFWSARAVDPGLGASLSQGFRGRPSLALVFIGSVINPVFEETLWLGYAVNGPGGGRGWSAVLWSVVPRCLVHLYQGWAALFLIGPVGLFFVFYYMRTRRLWPVIIAHGLMDLVALGWLALRGAT